MGENSPQNCKKSAVHYVKPCDLDCAFDETPPAERSEKQRSFSLLLNPNHQYPHRSVVEPIIGHLKSDHALGRNCLKGIDGDEINGRYWRVLSTTFACYSGGCDFFQSSCAFMAVAYQKQRIWFLQIRHGVSVAF